MNYYFYNKRKELKVRREEIQNSFVESFRSSRDNTDSLLQDLKHYEVWYIAQVKYLIDLESVYTYIQKDLPKLSFSEIDYKINSSVIKVLEK